MGIEGATSRSRGPRRNGDSSVVHDVSLAQCTVCWEMTRTEFADVLAAVVIVQVKTVRLSWSKKDHGQEGSKKATLGEGEVTHSIE